MEKKIGAKQKLIIFIVAIVVPLAMLTAVCVKLYYREFRPTPNYWKEVELEIINPTTGTALENGDTIDLPKTVTPIEVRVRDKETGEYLTDEDFPEIIIKENISIMLGVTQSDKFAGWVMDLNNWPKKSDIEKWKDFEGFALHVDFTPKGQDAQKGETRYHGAYMVVKFYINIV